MLHLCDSNANSKALTRLFIIIFFNYFFHWKVTILFFACDFRVRYFHYLQIKIIAYDDVGFVRMLSKIVFLSICGLFVFAKGEVVVSRHSRFFCDVDALARHLAGRSFHRCLPATFLALPSIHARLARESQGAPLATHACSTLTGSFDTPGYTGVYALSRLAALSSTGLQRAGSHLLEAALQLSTEWHLLHALSYLYSATACAIKRVQSAFHGNSVEHTAAWLEASAAPLQSLRAHYGAPRVELLASWHQGAAERCATLHAGHFSHCCHLRTVGQKSALRPGISGPFAAHVCI